MTPVEATLSARQALARGLEPQLAELRRLRPWRRLGEIGLFAALWGLGIVLGIAGLEGGSWALRLAGIAASAAALNAFFLMAHEAHHNVLFSRPALGELASVLLCIPLLHSSSAYRLLHDLHHRFLGGPGDPDEYRNYTSSSRVRWALHWVRLTMALLVYMPMIPVVAWRHADRSTRRRIAVECLLTALAAALAFAFVPARVLVQVWVIPGAVVCYVSAVRALAQHTLTPPSDPLLASRSIRSNRITAFFLLNENFHLEHHLFPEVPSYNLPALRALLRSRMPHRIEAPSYTRFLGAFVRRFLRGDESPLGPPDWVEGGRR